MENKKTMENIKTRIQFINEMTEIYEKATELKEDYIINEYKKQPIIYLCGQRFTPPHIQKDIHIRAQRVYENYLDGQKIKLMAKL